MVLLSSMSERLADAGINAAICIAVTFAVLIFISLIISLFQIFPKIEASIARKKAEKLVALNEKRKSIQKVALEKAKNIR